MAYESVNATHFSLNVLSGNLKPEAVASELRARVRWQTRVLAYCWPSSERRRQRSSMRSMKPEEAPGAAGFAGAADALHRHLRAQQHAAEAGDLPRERRGEIHRLRDEKSHAPRLRAIPRGPHHARAGACGDERSRVGHVHAVGEHRVRVQGIRPLAGRHGLAGQRRFVDL